MLVAAYRRFVFSALISLNETVDAFESIDAEKKTMTQGPRLTQLHGVNGVSHATRQSSFY